MIICLSRGIVASTRLSIFPRAMNNAPGMRPRFHSLGSRTSRKTIEGSSSFIFIDSAGVTSLIRVFASAIKSDPVFNVILTSRQSVVLTLQQRAKILLRYPVLQWPPTEWSIDRGCVRMEHRPGTEFPRASPPRRELHRAFDCHRSLLRAARENLPRQVQRIAAERRRE